MIPAAASQHKTFGSARWFDARVAWYGTRDDADDASRGHMTVEQALVYLLAAVAGIFLFLGLAQALEGRHGLPRRPRRRRAGGDPPARREEDAPVPTRNASAPAA